MLAMAFLPGPSLSGNQHHITPAKGRKVCLADTLGSSGPTRMYPWEVPSPGPVNLGFSLVDIDGSGGVVVKLVKAVQGVRVACGLLGTRHSSRSR